MLEIKVITVSDRAFRGEYEDLSGPKIGETISKFNPGISLSYEIVPDEREQLREALERSICADYIITTGGTGISPRDITPGVTRDFCDIELPGISEMLRAESLKETKNAVFSRGFSGLKEKTIIVNLPGSVKAVSFCTKLLLPILEHGVDMIKGGKH